MDNRYVELLLNDGLYDKKTITQETEEDWIKLLRGDIRISCYCPKCKDKRVFILDPPLTQKINRNGEISKLADYLVDQKHLYNMNHMPRPGVYDQNEKDEWFWRQNDLEGLTRIITLSFRCAMNDSHKLDFFLSTGADFVEKVGQKPSVADLSLEEMNRYKKVTSEQSLKELKRAIGLNAHGIGVGAYVYLRRIFERIIEKVKSSAIAKGDFQEGDFTGKRIDEMIAMLKKDLPDTMVDNKVFYKIVSKGIHELSEEECIKYFPVLRDAIILILREWQMKQDEQEAAASLSASLNRISSEI